MRFVNNARNKERQSGELTAIEIAKATHWWDQHIQKLSFGDILKQSDDRQSTARIKQLDLFIDNHGLLRCGGRFRFADVNNEAKSPVLLPKNNCYTDLVIRDCHERLVHAGVAHTLSQVRYKYWIIHGRTQVKRVLRKCSDCKRKQGGSFRIPPFPDLPEFRVTRQHPFSTVGVDYLGPLYIAPTRIGEQRVKVWICLFTCAVIRAVHLEVVEALSTQQFLMCFRRFCSIHGKPALIISDNAKQFKTANAFFDKIWSDVITDTEVQQHWSTQGISWKYITEFSPWMGGFYERLVGVVKTSLKRCLDARCVSLVELQTIVSEVAEVVNSRPLIYPESDLAEPPLTPAHFIGGPRCGIPSFALDEDEYKLTNTKPDELVHLWRRSQATLNNFWKSWRSQYLLSLRTAPGGFKQRNVSDARPTVGSIVLIKDTLPRNRWKIGKITKLSIGSDGHSRSAVVQLANKKMLSRPLRLLYPLELTAIDRAADGEIKSTNRSRADQRPKRAGARIAAGQIHQSVEDWQSGSSSESDTITSVVMHILVTPHHRLSHLYPHDPPLSFYGRNMSSIEKIRWYATLRQSGEDNLASRLRTNSHLDRFPGEIKEWVVANRANIHPEWLFRARHIYMDIMLRQLQHTSSGFHQAFVAIVDESEHPLELNFLVSTPSSECVWATGLRQTQLPADTFPGANAFGECLQDLVIRYLGNYLHPIIGTPQAYIYNSLTLNPHYSKSVLLLADSQARKVKHIAGGRVLSISGGCFQDLVQAVDQFRIHPRDFNIIIVCCGVNDAQRDVNTQAASWARMQRFLEQQLGQVPAPRVIVSLPVPHPDVRTIEPYSGWVEQQLGNTPGIRCVNWSTKLSCPFINESGQQNLALFDPDGFHLNHAGFRALINEWASTEDMVKYIRFSFTGHRRALKRYHTGHFV